MHLPVGISNFRELIAYTDPKGRGYLYVDKTNFIKDLIYDLTKVIVFTRPRRFGKTLNLSMLQHFYAAEVNGQSTRELFDNLQIAQHADCMAEQGQHPVVFITFKDTKYKTFDLSISHIKKQVINTYSEYKFLLVNDRLDDSEKDQFNKFLRGNVDRIDLDDSIKTLTKLIEKATDKKPIILIDEYDTPIQEAYLHGYYEELISFMKNLFSSALKDNQHFKRAILTGILRISKESLFSSLNNVKVCSILEEQYAEYFGFTEQETNELIKKSSLPSDAAKAKEWYNGYNFAGTVIYNPWSIIEFLSRKGKLAPYWINTSGNYLVKKLLLNADVKVKDKISQLISGNTISEVIDEYVVFDDLNYSRSAIWGLFVLSGYLKVLDTELTEFGNMCKLAIPNREVEFLYKQIFREWLFGSRGIIWYQELLANLTSGQIEEFEQQLQDAILEIASYHDTSRNKQETFYHGLMLGILSGLKDNYQVKSNRESGKGRYDLIIIPNNRDNLAVVMEFKAVDDESKLQSSAEEALEQINKSKYITEIKSLGITQICTMGIGFSGKDIKVLSK
jgi:hypothetical protein